MKYFLFYLIKFSMKIIGIISRKGKSEENHDIDYIYSNIVNMVYDCGAIPIGIVLNENYRKVINICDGIIFGGGDNFEEFNEEAMLYCYKKNIPTLGICLGMQLMGCVFDGKLIDISNHKNTFHKVKIEKKSKLYNIFNKEELLVNSRHKSVLKSTKLDITSKSIDRYIESIEDKNRKFFVGVQWHPEDINQKELFKKFIDS